MRRIELPSGKIIEVDSHGNLPLHICGGCGSNLVFPLEDTIEETEDERFSMTLRCPNCELCTDLIAKPEDCYALDDELEDAYCQMSKQLSNLTWANFAEEIERFVALMNDDRILPFDF